MWIAAVTRDPGLVIGGAVLTYPVICAMVGRAALSRCRTRNNQWRKHWCVAEFYDRRRYNHCSEEWRLRLGKAALIGATVLLVAQIGPAVANYGWT